MTASATPIAAPVRMMIEDMLSEFARRVDDGFAASVHELFAEDGRIETPQFVLEGRAAIAERFGARAVDTSRKTRHYWSNPKFSGDESAVKVITNVMTAVAITGGPTVLMGGSSHDVLVPRDGGWAFQSRRLELTFEGTLGALEPRT